MNYDCDYFISKFSVIPEEMWVVGSVGWIGYGGRFCALGFCGHRGGITLNEETNALCDLLMPLAILSPTFEFMKHPYEVVYKISDGQVGYKKFGKTPKKRILEALNYVKSLQGKEQEVQECDATKLNSSNEAKDKKVIHY